MFYRHVILKVNGEDVLYLYLTNAYEFAQDLGSKENFENISSRVSNYVKNRGISFHGNKVYLVVDGIIVGTVSLTQNSNYQEVISMTDLKTVQKENHLDEQEYQIVLEHEDHTIEVMGMEKYLRGVLATEILPTFHIEAIKAQAVIGRTYALKQMIEQNKVEAVNSQQIYRDINYYKFLWTDHYFEYAEKLRQAIEQTKGQYLTYQDKIIHPFYHFVSNGKTEDLQSQGEGFSYMESVSSIWDLDSPMYLKTIIKSLQEVASQLHISMDEVKNIQILETTRGNRIQKIKIGSRVLTGQSFANLLGFPSRDVSITVDQDQVRFTIRGVGHGLGMSQYGANRMGQAGYHYTQILSHYYPATKLWKLDLNNQSHPW